MLLVLNSQFVSPYHFGPNSGEGKPDLVVDLDCEQSLIFLCKVTALEI